LCSDTPLIAIAEAYARAGAELDNLPLRNRSRLRRERKRKARFSRKGRRARERLSPALRGD
jgi:hypothetical protein